MVYPFHADIIDSIYRRRLEGPLSPDPQSVLSAIINGALDNPWHNYAYSRKKAISFVGSVLSKNAVDKAGHDLYNTCCHRLPRTGYSKPIVIRKGQISPPSVAAFFALAHFCCRADVRVEYHSRDRIVNWPSHY
ncbi:hypothetical protein ARMSODRAFT_504168 [Armillaria solidipes]|uniref:Uncharacterized protein n=1 Tax=Armillaria solidipes TaxID=1076256 RepID=A0A2H3BZM5_9AGAR|nr:hypothetical protein ARMSODRAFT_504168 [Armillaria solidipes]